MRWRKSLGKKLLHLLRGESGVQLPARPALAAQAPQHREKDQDRGHGRSLLRLFSCTTMHPRIIKCLSWKDGWGCTQLPHFTDRALSCHADFMLSYRHTFSLVLGKPTFRGQLTEQASGAQFFVSFFTSCSWQAGMTRIKFRIKGRRFYQILWRNMWMGRRPSGKTYL